MFDSQAWQDALVGRLTMRAFWYDEMEMPEM